VLAIGRNKGWKDEVALGKKQNRLFTSIAHYQLIELLKYKGFDAGMLVVDIEESYTSKMSFVHNDFLPTRVQGVAPKVASGVRAGQFFKLKTRPNGLNCDTVHADLNGALNILRKTCPSFCYKPGFTLGFTMVDFRSTWQPFRRGLAASSVPTPTALRALSARLPPNAEIPP
jgi:transposase